MAYSQMLADRVENQFKEIKLSNYEAKKMFGGVGYLLHGNMACGILGDRLVVREGKDAYQDALQKPGTSEFNTTGRPMSGWVFVDLSAIQTDADLKNCPQTGVYFALTLSPK